MISEITSHSSHFMQSFLASHHPGNPHHSFFDQLTSAKTTLGAEGVKLVRKEKFMPEINF